MDIPDIRHLTQEQREQLLLQLIREPTPESEIPEDITRHRLSYGQSMWEGDTGDINRENGIEDALQEWSAKHVRSWTGTPSQLFDLWVFLTGDTVAVQGIQGKINRMKPAIAYAVSRGFLVKTDSTYASNTPKGTIYEDVYVYDVTTRGM